MKFINKHCKLNTTILALFVLSFCISCGSPKNIAASQPSIESSTKIIFLNYGIKKTEDGSRKIRFINQIIMDGTLKKIASNEVGISGDLICFQLDKKSNILQRILIKNPLNKNIESLDASKSFQRKQIDLDSTQFSIRLQLKPNTKYISIINFSTFKNQEDPLIKTQIY